jgi:hypothetical protein
MGKIYQILVRQNPNPICKQIFHRYIWWPCFLFAIWGLVQRLGPRNVDVTAKAVKTKG